MVLIAQWINHVLEVAQKWAELKFTEFEEKVKQSEEIKQVALEVKELCLKFPLNM